MSSSAERFSSERPGVNVEIIEVENDELSQNIVSQAERKTGLYDIFITPPNVMGDIVEEQGWADMTGFIDAEDWSDIFLSYRKSS